VAKCKACKADIWFVKTEALKIMPFDTEPSETGSYKIIEGNPRVASYVHEKNRHLEPILYSPHWSSCPHADRFRQQPVERPRYLAFALCPQCGRRYTEVLSDSRCGDCLNDGDRVVQLVEAKLEAREKEGER
jgi:hypothetical protein